MSLYNSSCHVVDATKKKICTKNLFSWILREEDNKKR